MEKKYFTRIDGSEILMMMLFISLPLNLISGTAEIKNFSKNDYNAASQNWAIDISDQNEIFIGNNLGLLEFDGVSWNLSPSPNGSIIRTVKVDNDRIYTGGYREIGYWQRNPGGKLVYNSLNHLIIDKFSTNEEFWNIVIDSGMVYFHSFTGLFVFNTFSGDFSVIKPGGFVNYITKIDGSVLFSIRGSGVYRVNGQDFEEVAGSKWFEDKTITSVVKDPNSDNILMATESKGIFLYDMKTGDFTQWPHKLNRFFSQNKINKLITTAKGEIVIGTILNGLIILDKEGNQIHHFNVDKGLQSNTVLNMTTDNMDNIWLTLDKGVDFVSVPCSRRFSDSFFRSDKIGAVYTAAVFEDKLYVGTNQGLYKKDIDNDESRFELVPGTQNQVWDCRIIDDVLFVGHNSGTFTIKNNKLTKISDYAGGYSIVKHPGNNDIIIQSTYSNLVVYSHESGKWEFSHTIGGFNNLINQLEYDNLGNLWASHVYQGLYKINLNDEVDSILQIKSYKDLSAAGRKNKKTSIASVENRTVFFWGDGIYTYDDLIDSIIPYNLLNEQLGNFSDAIMIAPAPGHHYWIINENDLACFEINNNTVKKLKEYPIEIFENQLIHMYENIVPVSSEMALLCLENGYAILDSDSLDYGDYLVNHKPRLREMVTSNRNDRKIALNVSGKNLKIPYSRNNIELRYSFPFLSNEEVFYNYKLDGLNNNWSDLLDKPVFSINRIPPGDYTLHVKAVNYWRKTSEESILSFTVSPPWYRTTLAFISYILILFILTLLFRYYTVRQIKLKELRKRREKEKELIELRNEKLRSELSFKSQQLASSTLSIIKKNEFLMSLKRQMKRQKLDLGTRYPDKYYNSIVDRIDSNISAKDDWKLFESNFEQAHERFLLNLKSRFPELTSSDLRLCAYLRINLNSKEIAPLMGITVRGVENHRYRLRKKLKISAKTSLTDFMLSLP